MYITVQATDTPGRIDAFLAKKLPNLSRSFIQKQIKIGSILVNNQPVSAHHRLRTNDVVSVSKTEKDEPAVVPDNTIALRIVDEQEGYVVIEKPAGLIMHPAPGITEPTLADALAARYPEISGVGDDALRPGIVHRLDRNVSGLLVAARTQELFEHLKKQFKNRSMHKEYLALVHGVVDEDGVIATPIGRSKTKSGKMATRPHAQQGDREALTEYRILEHYANYTLLAVTIKTGRSHQIRVHLNSIGHPVVGDTLYTNRRIKPSVLGRLFLHASKLEFDDINGVRKSYESPLPEELNAFLASL